MGMEKVYVFGTETAAEAFKMTAYHFGHEARRVGSALVMDRKAYAEVIEKTYAIPASIVAKEA